MSDETVPGSAPVESVTPPPAPPDGEQPTEGNEVAKAAAPDPGDTEARDELRGVAKRMKELTDRIRAAEQREERYLKLLEQGRQPEPQKQQAPARPKTLQDFNYDENAYRDHLYTDARQAAEQAAREAGTKWKAEQEAITRRATFDERVAKFSATVEDYNDVVTPSTPVSESMADAIMDSDDAGAVLYYLGKNPDLALKLYHLSPAKAGKEIQKIEDRLVAERKKAAEKPVSKAPPPTPRIEGSDPGTGNVKPDDPESDNISDSEWMRRRAKQVAKRSS